MASIRIITADDVLANDLQRTLEALGHHVAVAATGGASDGQGPAADATLVDEGVHDADDAELLRIRRGSDGALTVDLPDGGLNFESLERALIAEALRRCGGSPTHAARLLGMSRDTMRYRIEKFGVTATNGR